LEAIIEMLELRAAGQMFTNEEIQGRISAARSREAVPSGGPVAVLPLHGVIAPRTNMMTDISGGTSAEAFGQAFRAVIADPAISAVVLDVDSPGGSVFGMEELASIIRAGRGRKPIVAVANQLMASAAYWVASQADDIMASPSAQVGSIGVIGVHQDISEAEAKVGVKTTLVTAGTFKGDGNEHAPLSDSARATIQRMVDGYYAAFVQDVSRGRAVTAAQVRDGFGEGRILGAKDALRAGLIDGIGTLEQAVMRLASGSKTASLKAEGLRPEDIHSVAEGLQVGFLAGSDPRETAAEPMPPDEHGQCPDGHEMGDDGMCHKMSEAKAELADFRRRLAAHGT
jgi:signal peptide peptidase SppA